ncbi:branched-chain amino acid ABC transporter permease [Petroclostridium xylanilyticum]|uniref:branched-chain amino acid ABC transporter permease n=1 Tax=Petroclostridium xylanilyticum TaxID=1792311 RepID=UPI000B98DF6E|nr:branched-chain amino acid ABC transporter permease [Petroclostridium xylanilyticum]
MNILKFLLKNKLLSLASIALLLFPLFISSRYIVHVMVLIFMFASMGVAWNIIGGYGAQISWGHASFFAIGAYTSFLLFLKFNISPLVSIFLGMIVSVIVAFIIGYPSFRLRGVFFSLATIAFAEIVKLLLLYFSDFTGGANGLMITFTGQKPLYLQFYSETPYYYISLFLMVIIIFLTWKLENSKLGYFLKAIKEDEDAAESLGIKAYKIKLITFMISAAMMAVVGTIYAFNIAYIDPISVAHLDLSIKLGVIAIIGGIGTLWGPVLGAFLIIPLTEITNALLGSTRGGASTAIYGLILMIVVIFQPNGLMAFLNNKRKAAKSTPVKTSM